MSQSKFGGAIAIFLAVIVEFAVGLVVLTLAISVFMMGLHWPERAITIAVVGSEILAIAAIWAALYYGVLRKRTPRRPLLSLVILLILPALAAAGSWHLYQKDIAAGKTRPQQAEALALADLSLTVDRVVSSDGHSYSVNLHTSMNGEPGRIEQAAKKLLFDAPEADRRFADKRDALDINAVMAPKALGGEGGLDKATKALIDVRAAIVVRETEIDAAFSSCRKVLASADIDAGKKAAGLAEFDARVARDKTRRIAAAQIELDLYNEMMAIVGELKDARGHWWIERGAMIIADDDVRARVQAHWENVTTAEKRLHDASTY